MDDRVSLTVDKALNCRTLVSRRQSRLQFLFRRFLSAWSRDISVMYSNLAFLKEFSFLDFLV
jgi:hypothetical protein